MSEERDRVLHEGLYNYAVEAEEELDNRLKENGYNDKQASVTKKDCALSSQNNGRICSGN